MVQLQYRSYCKDIAWIASDKNMSRSYFTAESYFTQSDLQKRNKSNSAKNNRYISSINYLCIFGYYIIYW